MRNLHLWATQHRAGFRRGRAIITRQEADHKRSITLVRNADGKHHGAAARRKRQIAKGQLKAANGLQV